MRNVCTVIGSLTRIGLACSAALMLNTAFSQDFQSHPSTQDASVRVTLETLARWEDELSNWGRWGSRRPTRHIEPDYGPEDETGGRLGSDWGNSDPTALRDHRASGDRQRRLRPNRTLDE